LQARVFALIELRVALVLAADVRLTIDHALNAHVFAVDRARVRNGRARHGTVACLGFFRSVDGRGVRSSVDLRVFGVEDTKIRSA
jgi:hypothetical protein